MKELKENPATVKVVSEVATWVFRIALTILVSFATSYASKIDDVNKTVTILAAQLPELEKRIETLERYVFIPKQQSVTPP